MAIVLTIAALAILFKRSNRSSPKINNETRLLMYGAVQGAQVLDVIRRRENYRPRLDIGLRFQWKDQVYPTFKSFSDVSDIENMEKLKVGDEITVLVNPHHPTDFAVYSVMDVEIDPTFQVRSSAQNIIKDFDLNTKADHALKQNLEETRRRGFPLMIIVACICAGILFTHTKSYLHENVVWIGGSSYSGTWALITVILDWIMFGFLGALSLTAIYWHLRRLMGFKDPQK